MTPQKTTYNLDTHVPTELHEVDAHVDTSHAESGSHGNGHHDGPHVLDVSPEATFHFDVFGMDIGITPIVITTWIYIAFMAIICIMFAIAFKRKKGKMFMTGFLMVRGFYHFFSDIIENKKFTQKVVFLLGGIFFYIITANIFSLMVEWLAFSIPSMHYYVRGINTDISTTLGLALTVIIVSHFVMIKHRGFGGYLK